MIGKIIIGVLAIVGFLTIVTMATATGGIDMSNYENCNYILLDIDNATQAPNITCSLCEAFDTHLELDNTSVSTFNFCWNGTAVPMEVL